MLVDRQVKEKILTKLLDELSATKRRKMNQTNQLVNSLQECDFSDDDDQI
jgi:hypothetical protein